MSDKDDTYPVTIEFTMQFPKGFKPGAFEHAEIDDQMNVKYQIDLKEYHAKAVLMIGEPDGKKHSPIKVFAHPCGNCPGRNHPIGDYCGGCDKADARRKRG